MEKASGLSESYNLNQDVTDNLKTNISHIPDEILLNSIFFLFDKNELSTLSLVCKKWNVISLDPHLYRHLYKTYFPEQSVPLLENNENWHPRLILEIETDRLTPEFKQIRACQKLMKTFSTNIPIEAFITLKELRDIHNLEILYTAIKNGGAGNSTWWKKTGKNYKRKGGKTWRRRGNYKNLKNNEKLEFIRKKIIERLYKPSKPITELTISAMGLTSLPREIGYFSQLKTLKIEFTTITRLPAEVGKLTHLRLLMLSNNILTILPPEIGDLPRLLELSLRNNELESLPVEIGKLTELRELNLEGNKIKSLPLSIKNLPKLSERFRRDFENYAIEE